MLRICQGDDFARHTAGVKGPRRLLILKLDLYSKIDGSGRTQGKMVSENEQLKVRARQSKAMQGLRSVRERTTPPR